MKVMCSMLLVALIVLIAGLACIYGTRWINKSLNEIVMVNLPGIIALETIHEAQTAIQRDERNLLLRRALSDEVKARLTKGIEDAWKRADAARNIYEQLPKSKEAATAWNRFKPAWETWKKDQQKVSNLRMADRRTVAAEISQSVTLVSFDKVEELMGEVLAINEKDSKTATERTEKAASILKGALIGLLVLSIILIVTIGIRINRDLTNVIAELKEEVRTTVNATIGGKLTIRGDPEKVNYEFREIVNGLNDTLAAVIGPLNVADDYLGRISQGETPSVIRDNYNGDFNLIKNNLNACIEAAAQQINAAQKLAAGDLSGQIHGRNERDILAISMNNAFAILDNLRKETERLTKALQEGMLSERGQTEQFQGAYAEIMQGVNKMLDAVLEAVSEPLKAASEYKERLSKGEISPKRPDIDKDDATNIFLKMVAKNKPYL
ncbi:MAG: MCP four helix bundle domain-containing protein [Syntrophales bacterium LBB04]|nr:MCP four helix bundle domain-containing protein [Syntrophales bacterium LBB04]